MKIAKYKCFAPQVNDDKSLLSRLETANFLKIKLASLWKQTKSGQLKYYVIGDRVFCKRYMVLEKF